MQVQTIKQRQPGQPLSKTGSKGSQQLQHVLAALQHLDSTYAALHADLIANWPTALDSPAMQIDLHSLKGLHSTAKAGFGLIANW